MLRFDNEDGKNVHDLDMTMAKEKKLKVSPRVWIGSTVPAESSDVPRVSADHSLD